MKRLGMIALFVGIPLIVAGLLAAYPQMHEQKPAQKTADGHVLPLCPVGGEPINFAVSTATDSGPVFFCCAHCISKFEADPKKYADKVASQRKALEVFPRTQVTCPVTGEPTKKDVIAEVKGTKVNLCCKGCRGKYEKDPAKYATKLANAYTYQTKCPVTGKPIDPKVSAKAPKGETVFFCCKDCPEKFGKEPERFAPKLAEQGFSIELPEK